jgi:predicted nucleic-acid-binding protein
MIGLDTNVLVRYLTHDDPAQFAKAAAVIDAAAERGEQLLVNTSVLCELVWVLANAYEY